MKTIQDIMTTGVITLKSNNSLFKGREIMKKHGIRHIPVEDPDDGVFVGVLTQKAVLSRAIAIINARGFELLEETEKGIAVDEVMDQNVSTAPSDMSLLEAAEHFMQHKHGCLVVADGGKIKGIVTSVDFVKLAARLLSEQ